MYRYRMEASVLIVRKPSLPPHFQSDKSQLFDKIYCRTFEYSREKVIFEISNLNRTRMMRYKYNLKTTRNIEQINNLNNKQNS